MKWKKVSETTIESEHVRITKSKIPNDIFTVHCTYKFKTAKEAKQIADAIEQGIGRVCDE